MKPKLTKNLSSEAGGLPYGVDGDARRKFWIQPLKETNPGVAEAYETSLYELGKYKKNQNSFCFVISSRATLNET